MSSGVMGRVGAREGTEGLQIRRVGDRVLATARADGWRHGSAQMWGIDLVGRERLDTKVPVSVE